MGPISSRERGRGIRRFLLGGHHGGMGLEAALKAGRLQHFGLPGFGTNTYVENSTQIIMPSRLVLAFATRHAVESQDRLVTQSHHMGCNSREIRRDIST